MNEKRMFSLMYKADVIWAWIDSRNTLHLIYDIAES